jgi:hypothetical protein
VGPGTGSRRRGGWPSAGVSASRQPRCRLRDCPFRAGRATWWQLVIPGRQSQRWTTARPPRPARGTRAPEEGSRWCGPGWGPVRDPAREGPPEPGLGTAGGPVVTTASPPDRSQPPRLAAASPGWRHRPWRACRASGQRNGRGLRRWPRPSGMRAAPSMPRDAAGGPADPVLTRLRCGACRAGWPPRGPAAAGSPAASDAIGGMRHRQQCAPSRHRARTRRSETRRPDGVCSRSVIGVPPDRSAHSRRSGRQAQLWDAPLRLRPIGAICARRTWPRLALPVRGRISSVDPSR